MSLINAFNLGDRALISADTDAVFANGSRGNVSKLLTIPHANAVIAVRGYMAVLTEAHAQFATLASDFDKMIEMAEIVIQFALGKVYGSDFPGGHVDGVEMIVAGYSPRLGKVTVNMFRCKSFGEPVEEFLDLKNVICPGDLGVSLEGITASADSLAILTRRQVDAIKRNSVTSAAGGGLVVAEVRRGRVTVDVSSNFFTYKHGARLAV